MYAFKKVKIKSTGECISNYIPYKGFIARIYK